MRQNLDENKHSVKEYAFTILLNIIKHAEKHEILLLVQQGFVQILVEKLRYNNYFFESSGLQAIILLNRRF